MRNCFPVCRCISTAALHFCLARAAAERRASETENHKEEGGGGGGEVAVHGRERDGDNPRELDAPLLCEIVIIIADWLKMTVLMS